MATICRNLPYSDCIWVDFSRPGCGVLGCVCVMLDTMTSDSVSASLSPRDNSVRIDVLDVRKNGEITMTLDPRDPRDPRTKSQQPYNPRPSTIKIGLQQCAVLRNGHAPSVVLKYAGQYATFGTQGALQYAICGTEMRVSIRQQVKAHANITAAAEAHRRRRSVNPRPWTLDPGPWTLDPRP
eukprot:3429637-Rhodomonas_salina.1